MFGLGMWELIIILVIVLIVFGAGKIPEIGKGIGEGIQNFKKASRELENKKSEPQVENKKADSQPEPDNKS